MAGLHPHSLRHNFWNNAIMKNVDNVILAIIHIPEDKTNS